MFKNIFELFFFLKNSHSIKFLLIWVSGLKNNEGWVHFFFYRNADLRFVLIIQVGQGKFVIWSSPEHSHLVWQWLCRFASSNSDPYPCRVELPWKIPEGSVPPPIENGWVPLVRYDKSSSQISSTKQQTPLANKLATPPKCAIMQTMSETI